MTEITREQIEELRANYGDSESRGRMTPMLEMLVMKMLPRLLDAADERDRLRERLRRLQELLDTNRKIFGTGLIPAEDVQAILNNETDQTAGGE